MAKSESERDDRERALFVELINACAPQHFVKSDAPLLAAYVQSILLSRSAAKHAGKDPAALALGEINANDGNAGNEVALEPAT